MKPCVVMRSHNDMPLVAATLAALRKSESVQPFQLLVFDNASTDGTFEEASKYADQVIHVPKGQYVPGRVLNHAMREASGDFVTFLNSDCTPCNDEWLRRLLAGFTGDGVAAVFGRQIPRADCDPLFARDTEDTFGDGSRQASWRHCFSMALSSVRRSAWSESPFSESIQYSEDIDWSWRARRKGQEIRYVADSVVMHSHNYTLGQFYRRQYGEGRAEAVIFDWDSWQRSLLRYSVLPYGRQVLGDLKYCLPRLLLGSALKSPALRMAQLLGRRAGFLRGFREREQTG